MTNDESMTDDEIRRSFLRHSGFDILSSFRHSSFVIVTP